MKEWRWINQTDRQNKQNKYKRTNLTFLHITKPNLSPSRERKKQVRERERERERERGRKGERD
jgi:hypothetical protein